MHRIAIYSIGKKDEKCYEAIYEDLIKNSKKFALIETKNIFNKKINTAQSDAKKAMQAYSDTFKPYILSDGFNIALDPEGKCLDSFAFAHLLKEHTKVAFFIGGAYGLQRSFVQSCDMALSLSPLTMSHKIAKMVLLEQLFRGLSIIHNHPYHK